MDQLFYVMAILGCGDAGTDCTEARLVETRYVTAQQCRADLPAMLARNTDLSYPVVAASCRRNAPEIAKVTPKAGRG